MTRILHFTGALIIAVGLCTAAVAQDQNSQPSPGGQGQGPRGGMRRGEMNVTPQERVERMGRLLNLTDDQKTKMLSIFEEQQKKMQDLRNDTSLSQQDRRTKTQESHEWTMAQVRGVLNAEQQQKLDKMEERAKQRREKPQSPQGPPTPKQ